MCMDSWTAAALVAQVYKGQGWKSGTRGLGKGMCVDCGRGTKSEDLSAAKSRERLLPQSHHTTEWAGGPSQPLALATTVPGHRAREVGPHGAEPEATRVPQGTCCSSSRLPQSCHLRMTCRQ